MDYSRYLRNYALFIEPRGSKEPIAIYPPISIEFDITRNVLSSANICQLRIYNLSSNHRNILMHHSFAERRIENLRKVELHAGYGKNLSIIFQGNITQAWSERQGVNFITYIECYDSGFAFLNSDTSTIVPKGAKIKEVIGQLSKDLPLVSKGIISDFPGETVRRVTLEGNTMKLIKSLVPGDAQVFIDNGKFFAVNKEDMYKGEIDVINSASGLLGTPIRTEAIINFDMIFEPRLAVGQVIRLDSQTAGTGFNALYKVISVKHRGMISESVAGTATTSVGVYFGTGLKELT